MVRSLRTATVPVGSLGGRLAFRTFCRRNVLLGYRRYRNVGTCSYLHIIGRNVKSNATAIKMMASRISIRADPLSVPKTIGTGPIMMTPPPRTDSEPLADLRTAMMTAIIPIANPATTSRSPMLKIVLSVKLRSSLTVLGHDIGLP